MSWLRRTNSRVPNPTLSQRALGAYLGLAVGDALGATVEFMTPSEIKAEHGVLRQIKGGGWLRLLPGQVTDDTTMCLALGRAILGQPEWNLAAIAEGFVAWMRNRPVDIGATCRRGLRRYLANGSLTATPAEEDAGNGAAMRNLPVVLAHLDDPVAMRSRSLGQAHLTHHNALSDAAILCLAEITRRLALGYDWEHCAPIADDLVLRIPQFSFRPWPMRTSGYIVDTFQTVLHVLTQFDTFEDCLIHSVNLGGDADTIGALVGQVAGARFGVDAIPRAWLQRLDPTVRTTIEYQSEALLQWHPVNLEPAALSHDG